MWTGGPGRGLSGIGRRKKPSEPGITTACQVKDNLRIMSGLLKAGFLSVGFGAKGRL